MPRKDPVTGRYVKAERTTTTTTVAERLTIHHDPPTEPLTWAPGHLPTEFDPETAREWRQQRQTQYQRTWDLIAAAADDGHTRLDEGTLRQAVTMLRALPGASCMEAEHGRSI